MLATGPVQPPKKFQFIGGALCLDFCNTVGGKRGVIAREKLHGYADFLNWCEQAGLAPEPEALRKKSERSPDEAASVLARAIELREAIYRILAAKVERKAASGQDLDLLNAELARGLGRLRVTSKHGRYHWEWPTAEASLDQALGPIVRSAAELLVSADSLIKVRRCHGDGCGWLFLDVSKNHSRRWCDMRDCGNRAKVRRHRRKQHHHTHAPEDDPSKAS